MPTIPLGLGDWESTTQSIVRTRLRNMYIIENPSSADGMSRILRPVLKRFTTVTNNPIYGAWRQEGSLGGRWLLVSGEDLYEYTGGSFNNVGSVPGTEYVQFAATPDRVLFVRDGVAYAYDGTTLSTIVMPDDLEVSSVASINSYFLLAVKDSQKFYWIEPAEINPTALDFASAERIPDNIVSVNVMGDEVWFLGGSGVEVWQPTGDSDDPFLRIPARVYTESCATRDAVREVSYKSSPALMWVTREGGVVIAQGNVSVVSNSSVEEKIREGSNFRSWTFRHLRNNFYVLSGESFTYVMDLDQNTWLRWDTYGKNHWDAHLGFQDGSTVYAFDRNEGIVYTLEEGEDDDGTPVVAEATGFIPLLGRPEPCYNVSVFCNTGWTSSYTVEPTIQMRWSDDNGATFTPYETRSLGQRGEFATDIWFRSMGFMRAPGRYFEFRYSGPGPFRLDFAVYNEE